MPSNENEILFDFHHNCANLKSREIFLHNHHSYEENPGVEYKMSVTFIKNLRALCIEGDGDLRTLYITTAAMMIPLRWR